MKCPVCNTVDLTMADRQGIEIDYCPQCRKAKLFWAKQLTAF